MPAVRRAWTRFRCPDCGAEASAWMLPGEAPDCPVCAPVPEGEVVAPFVSNPGIRRASAIAERGAIAQSEGVRGEIQMSAADMKTAGELIQHVREDISEHRIAAPQGRPAPQERMQNADQRQIQAAIPFGQAYRAATGTSPIERHQLDVAAGRAFDANHLLGGRR